MSSSTTTATGNSFGGDVLEKLDIEFNDLLDQMKSHVLNLTRKSGKMCFVFFTNYVLFIFKNVKSYLNNKCKISDFKFI